MRFYVTLDRDEGGAWIAECPSIRGCVSQRKTKQEAVERIQEAVENITEAIALCLEMRNRRRNKYCHLRVRPPPEITRANSWGPC